ncbi:MAG: MFS transporter [Chloroflexota bacterium]|nr:MFS transporter [Chloroflexota bacterium]
MEEQPRGRRLFYGWWIVAVSFIVLMLHTGAAFYSFSRFLPTLVGAFGSTTAAIAGVASVYMLVAGLVSPVIGKLSDMYSPRLVISVGAVLAGGALMLVGAATQVWHLYALYVLVGVGFSAAGFVPVNVVLSNWFVRRRGLAVGIANVGMSLGAALLAPLVGFLIDGIGWRMAFVTLGVLTVVLVTPATMLVMRTKPEDKGLLPDGVAAVEVAEASQMPDLAGATGADDPGWTLSGAVRTLGFWMLMVAFFLTGLVIAGVLQNEVNFLTIMGIPMVMATFALGFTGGIGGLGKLVFGFVADKLGPRYTALLCFTLQLVGVVVLFMTRSPAMVWVFVFVYGFAMGGNVTMQPLLTAQLYGISSFGAIFGWMALAGAVGSALGPVIGGAIYDVSGSYSIAFIVFIAVYAVAIGAVLLARKPKPRGGDAAT